MKHQQIDKILQAVLKAAKDGKLSQLKTSLAGRSSAEVKVLTSARVEGTTPLIAACREGHVDIVHYLVTKCHADLQQCGSVIFDGETIEGDGVTFSSSICLDKSLLVLNRNSIPGGIIGFSGEVPNSDAPPLWCAAAAGHLNIVKCLINHKANPNCTTRTNSTPLRAACFDGHLGIVKYLLNHKANVEIANRHEHTCLMIACYKGHTEIVKTLLEAGADVNRSSIKQNTALHDCAEHGSVTIAKLLLKHNSRCKKDSYGMTPLMTAAVAGHVQLVEFFSSLPGTSRLDKIEANELLGATYLDKKHDLSKAVCFWRKALERRSVEPVIERPNRVPVAAYGYISEPRTIQELDDIRLNFEQCRMVALLIRERILGPRHPDTSYYIRYRGAVCADAGDFERCIKLWMYALDMQRNNLDPLYPMTLSSLLSFAELFSFMQQNRSHMSSTVPKVSLSQIVEILERAVNEIRLGYKAMLKNTSGSKDKAPNTKTSPNGRSSRTGNDVTSDQSSISYSTVPITSTSSRRIGGGVSNRNASSSCCSMCEVSNQRVYQAMVITLHLTALSTLVEKDVVNSADTAFREVVRKRNKLLYSLKSVRDHCDHSLLHLASCAHTYSLGRYPVASFPNIEVTSVLLKCGFDPNARDCDGRTPAHLTADIAKHSSGKSIFEIINRLLQDGAHVDQVDNNGDTVLDLLGPKSIAEVNYVKHQSLQCLAARALRRGGVEVGHVLPPDLLRFVQVH